MEEHGEVLLVLLNERLQLLRIDRQLLVQQLLHVLLQTGQFGCRRQVGQKRRTGGVVAGGVAGRATDDRSRRRIARRIQSFWSRRNGRSMTFELRMPAAISRRTEGRWDELSVDGDRLGPGGGRSRLATVVATAAGAAAGAAATVAVAAVAAAAAAAAAAVAAAVAVVAAAAAAAAAAAVAAAAAGSRLVILRRHTQRKAKIKKTEWHC